MTKKVFALVFGVDLPPQNHVN